MNYFPTLLSMTAAVAIIQPQVVAALPFSEINQIAQEITVQIETSGGIGSGVIINQEGNTYSVLTTQSVVQEITPDQPASITTSDGEVHPLEFRTIQKLPQVDLAVVQFTSDRTYKLAAMGDSDQITQGSVVYVGGWSQPGGAISQSIFEITDGKISSRLPEPLDSGYALIYTNLTRTSMIGSPLLNEQGRLVGIHGRVESDSQEEPSATKPGFNVGIPLNTFLDLAPSINLSLNLPPLLTTDPPLVSQTTSTNYTTLRDLLAEQQWQQADDLTFDVMLAVAGMKVTNLGRDSQLDIEQVPCEDLKIIDALWLKYSNGQFGFSVQKTIWESLESHDAPTWTTYDRFGNQVGWRSNGSWLKTDQFVTYDLSAPPGHLPAAITEMQGKFLSQYHFSQGCEGGVLCGIGEVVKHGKGLLFSHAAACNLDSSLDR